MITYTVDLGRPATPQDREDLIGYEGFLDKLVAEKYLDKDRDTAIKPFHVDYSATGNVIEWQAIAR